jgi:hypothetical protein
MDINQPSKSSSIPEKEPITSRALYLKNFLQKKAIDLQNRENRQSLPYIKELMRDLQEIKFECLHSQSETLDLFATISKKAEICEQQLKFNNEEIDSDEYMKMTRKRRKKKLKESFGFTEFKDGNYSEDDMIIDMSDEDDEPDYLKHFQMEKKLNEEIIWGKNSCQIETDGLEARPEFRDIKYTVLTPEQDYKDRISIVKK